MSQVKTYKLYIYNDGVDATTVNKDGSDVPVEFVTVFFNSKTSISYTPDDGDAQQLSLSLFGVNFVRKMFQPGVIHAEMQITPGNSIIPSFANLQDMLVRKKVKLVITVDEHDYTVADNYYIHEITPLYEKIGGSTSIYVCLTIYSMDNLMRLNPFSQVFLGKRLFNQILLGNIADYSLQVSSENSQPLEYNIGSLQHLTLPDDDQKDEFRQPYLVQYNETFYDFVVRTANRCGEFLFFENGKLQAGLDENKLTSEKKIEEYSRITFRYASQGPLSVKLYTHDSIKNEDEDPATAKSKEPDKLLKGTLNIDQHHETGAFPSLDSTTKQKIYNSELSSDEYYMPLYRDQFSSGFITEYLKNNIGDVGGHFLSSLAHPTVMDIISDNALYIAMSITQAALDGDKANEDGNKIIDTYAREDENGNEANMAVPFQSNDREKWLALRYYRDIKDNQETVQRQTVCVDLGSSFDEIQMGQVVKLDNDTRKYLVVGIEMQADQSWQRSYEGFDTDSKSFSDGGMFKVYAIPSTSSVTKTIKDTSVSVPLFYPPLLPQGPFKLAEPQHAIVIDSDDPKKYGRVRVRYPWQQDVGDENTEGSIIKTLKDTRDALNTQLEEYKKTDTSKMSDDDKAQLEENIAQCEEQIFEASLDIEALAEAATPWIRMTTPMATKGGGVYFKPEKGDEVLINYENGNIERPYAVGTLYSKNAVAPEADRIIMSRNGHYIKMEDPDDVTKLVAGFLPGIGLLKDFHLFPSIDVPDVNEDEDSAARQLIIDSTRNLIGGITISDSLGVCSITSSTHNRKISIQSTIGNVTIDSLTGISLSAPCGDIKIHGKNVEILADNCMTLMSGRNIKPKKTLGITKELLANTLGERFDDIAGKFLDLSFIRSIVEIFLFPVNGVMEIKSLSFLVLEAGSGIAEIPESAYTERALANRSLLSKDEKTSVQGEKQTSGSAYKAIAYVAATFANANFGNRSKEIGRLFNDASAKLAVLHAEDPADQTQKLIFSDGLGLITNVSSDDFVEKSLDAKTYLSIWNDIKWKKGAKTSDMANNIKAAYGAVRALKKYCDETVEIFMHYSALESRSIYLSLSDVLKKTLSDDKVKDLDWVKKITNFNAKDDTIKLYSYFVNANFTPKTINTNTNADYDDAAVKKFQRCLCYNFLGDSADATIGNPVNDVEFIKTRNLKIDSINSNNGVRIKTKDDIVNGVDTAWSDYIGSMTLKDDSADKSFLALAKENILQKLDEKITFSPDRDVWNADVKGRILMSDSSETVSLNHTPQGVTLKADPNSQFNAKTIDSATTYLRALFSPLG